MEMKTLMLLATVQSDFPEMNVLLTKLSFVLFARFTFDRGRSHHKGERRGAVPAVKALAVMYPN